MSDRAALYDRLPLLEGDAWWLDQAPAGGRVLELGAGTGRLTAAFLAAGHPVTAVEHDPGMLDRLQVRVGDRARVVAGDATADLEVGRFDLVALPASLLNELPDAVARVAVLRTAAAACAPAGRVALHVLGPWWLARMPDRSNGRLHPADGGRPIDVAIEAGAFDPLAGRRQATLHYRFADGAVHRDHLDAAVVSPGELRLHLEAAGLVPRAWFGAVPPAPPASDDPAWHVVAQRADAAAP